MNTRIRVTGVLLTVLLLAIPGFADTRLIFPRVVFQSGLFSGIAISNPTGAAATIKLTAYNLDGTPLSGTGTLNGVTPAAIPSGGQYLNTAGQVFDPNSVLTGTTPKYFWVEVTSTTTGLAGFYIEGDNSTTYQYGGDLGTFGTDLYLPAIVNSGTTTTELSLVNADTSANGGTANITVDFLKSDGTNVGSKNMSLNQAASLQGPLAGFSAFSGVALDQVAALRVRADRPVLCYGIVKPQSGKTPIALPGEDVTTPAKTLYFPQLADGGGWSTTIGIANLNFSAQVIVNITAYDKFGNVFVDPTITNPKSVTIPAGGSLRSTFADLFPFTDTSYKEGWLQVDAPSPSINGYVEYGFGNNRALVIAQLNPYQLSMFSHQAQAATCSGCPAYFTGLAILNAGTLAANVEVFSLDATGKTSGRRQTVLKPGQRVSELLLQIVSDAAQTNGGSVFVRSDRPVFTTELFAVNDKGNVRALANVPPQQVTASFNPQSSLPQIVPNPQLAVIETGKTRQFSVTGISGTVNWTVNGGAGDNTTGTINSAGLYSAPAKAPAPHTLTIQAAATTGDNSGASSIDVVQREQLTGGLTVVTAVAYLDTLRRFFVAEQKLASSAPSNTFAATTYNTQISEVVSSGGSTSNVAYLAVSGDTISKMLPYDSGGTSYMLLAGKDLGKIYRLDVVGKVLKTVVSGLNQPTSMAVDPITGNLLVAESGAQQVTIVTAAQIAAASDPSVNANAPGTGRRLQALAVPNIQGIAVDRCTGSVYVTDTGGNLTEYQGASKRVVETGLDHPTQLQAFYRAGFSCQTALTIGIVEASRVSLSYPKANITRTSLLDGVQGVNDITFFPKGNPFTTGGEASVGVAQASTTPNQGTVTDVPMGGAYQATPPIAIGTPSGIYSGTGPNEDPIGDVFNTDLFTIYNQQVPGSNLTMVPDIVSVTGSTQGSQSIITIKFAAPVSLGTLTTTGALTDSLWVFIFMKTVAGSQALSTLPPEVAQVFTSLSTYFPFGNVGSFVPDSFLGAYFSDGFFFSSTQQTAQVAVSAIGNVVTLSVPTSALVLRGTTAVILVGNNFIFTDVAPNNGVLSLGQ